MNPIIGSMRREREMKELTKKKHPMPDHSLSYITPSRDRRQCNRPIVPELRSIPLTFLDCPDRCDGSSFMIPGGHVCKALKSNDWWSLTYCEINIPDRKCPRGYAP